MVIVSVLPYNCGFFRINALAQQKKINTPVRTVRLGWNELSQLVVGSYRTGVCH